MALISTENMALLSVNPKAQSAKMNACLCRLFSHGAGIEKPQTVSMEKLNRWVHIKDKSDWHAFIYRHNEALQATFSFILPGQTSRQLCFNLIEQTEDLYHFFCTDISAIFLIQQQTLDAISSFTFHELNAPHQAIANLASWIEEDYSLPQGAQEHLNLLSQRNQRCLKLLGDFRIWRTLQRLDHTPGLVDIKDMVERCVSEFDDGQYFIELACPYEVIAPTGLLQSALTQILNNCIKHHEQVPCIKVQSQLANDSYTLLIEDDGPGIAATQRDTALMPFKTLAPKDQKEGSGLGLNIATRAIELMGGQLELDSPSRGGLKVILSWPVPEQW